MSDTNKPSKISINKGYQDINKSYLNAEPLRVLPLSRFWSFVSPPNIDDILKKAKNIDDILEEDNILNGIKQQGSKFAEYLKCRPQQLKQMVNYVIEEQDTL